MTNRQIFLSHIGQTSPSPLGLEIVRAKGCSLFDINGKEYLDLIGGISVCNVGHGNRKVIQAIQAQAEDYMHVMVNGELILSPQTAYAQLLTNHLPASLNAVFFTASGSEATEGAMKMAKRYTGKTNIVAFKKSYHGSTQGSLSIIGDEYWRNAFRPLLPGIQHLNYNNFEDLEQINDDTACVIAETFQSEAGVIAPQKEWLQALQKKCAASGALLVLDEIQCGFGRNGTLWGFEQFNVIPDILLLGKALGGGMPLGAFVAGKGIMDCLTENPVLGHMNTFGGHPVCCAAGKAAMDYLLEENLISKVAAKSALFAQNIRKDSIKGIRCEGLMIAIEFNSAEENQKVIETVINNGIFTDWFLFAPQCLRIVPPLIITEAQIEKACDEINKAISLL